MFIEYIRKIESLDQAAMLFIQKRQTRALTAILRFFTYTGTGITWLIASGVVSLLQWAGVTIIPAQHLFLRAMLCSLLAYAVSTFTKKALGRKRPSEAIACYVSLIKTPSCQSFPSSHAASAIAYSLALFHLHHDWAPYALAWALVVTFSRYYLGVHFPVDLLGGMFLGTLCSGAIYPITHLLLQ